MHKNIYRNNGSVPFLYSYERMQSDLNNLKKSYPAKICTKVLAVTADEREVTDVILGCENASCHILIHAAIHGREYMNTYLVMNQIRDYLQCYDKHSESGESWRELYENVCFHIVPMANPDGVTISQQGMEGIRNLQIQDTLMKCYLNDCSDGKGDMDRNSYFRRWKANASGIDLNRNFDAGWEIYAGSEHPSSDSYKGSAPASEEETKAILSIARDYSLACCIAYHSSGNLIYWDYGSCGEILEEDRKLAECVGNSTQYELHSTVQDAADCAGCSDYFVLKLGIPAVTVETGESECPLPASEYRQIYERNKNLWSVLANLYGNKKIIKNATTG